MEAEVEAAYLAAMQLSQDLQTDPSTPLGRLEEGFGDPYLGALTLRIQESRDADLVVELPKGSQVPTVEAVDVYPDGTALIGVCIVDQAVQVERATGEVADDSESSRRAEVVLTRVGHGWVATNVSTTDRWDDAAGCDR